MHVEATARLSCKAVVCPSIVRVIAHCGHEGLLEAEGADRLDLTRLLHRRAQSRGHRRFGGLLGRLWVVIRVLSLLFEHDHDLADLGAGQRTVIICITMNETAEGLKDSTDKFLSVTAG